MDENIGIFLLILSFFLSLSFLSILFGLYGIFLINDDKIVGNPSEIVKKYQYFEKDYLKNETLLGVVSFLEEIGDFEYYGHSSLQKQILISKFGKEEYECYGSCYCEEGDSRRFSQSGVLVKGVSYLLAAASAIVALDLANEYFSENCERKYSHVCESKSIRSEVEECKEISDFESSFEDGYGEKRVYFCYGNCVTSLQLLVHPSLSSERINCKKLRQEANVEVNIENVFYKTNSKTPSQKMRETARSRFQQNHLTDFCKKSSIMEYVYRNGPYTQMVNGKKKKTFVTQKRVGYRCRGLNNNRNTGKSELSNVNCRQIYPKPKSKNDSYWERIWWEKKKEWDEM